MGEHLPLVVDRAPGIEIAVALGGLERGRKPLVERVGRLDVVMAIGQAGGLAGGVQPVPIDQRMTGGLDHPDMLQANALQFPGQALGGQADVARVLGKGRNGRNTEQRFEFLEETRLLATGKLERGWHGWFLLWGGSEGSKRLSFDDFRALRIPSDNGAAAAQDVS